MAELDNTLTLPKRGRGRPAERVYSVAEMSSLLEMPERFVEARLRIGGFFPGAREHEGVWRIPERAVRHCLGCRVRPLFSIRTAADLLGLNYFTVFKMTAVVKDLTAPLPQGKRLRALLLFLSDDGEPKKRIHEDELLRFQGVHS